MKPDTVRAIVISDIHLGNKRNNTEYILKSLYAFFRDLPNKESIDIIFLGGDVFDNLLDFNSNDSIEISIWIDWLLEYCLINNIHLRVLEGTPSHDWKQSKWFNNIQAITKSPVYFKYVDTLSLEYIPELDFSILYIPDEWNSDNQVTYNQVIELLKDNGLNKVDFICMHGQFDYQIPDHLTKIPRHFSHLYTPLANYYISIGHVHTYSTYENIVAQGSFDRLAHNEEEPKGGVEFIMNKDGTKSFKFIENKLARIFKTITIKESDIDLIYKKIDKALIKIPAGSFVRLRLSKDNVLLSNFKQLSIKYPNINWSHVLDKEETVSQSLFLDNQFTKHTSIVITKDNILDLISSKIEEKNYLNKDKLLSTLRQTLSPILT